MVLLNGAIDLFIHHCKGCWPAYNRITDLEEACTNMVAAHLSPVQVALHYIGNYMQQQQQQHRFSNEADA